MDRKNSATTTLNIYQLKFLPSSKLPFQATKTGNATSKQWESENQIAKIQIQSTYEIRTVPFLNGHFPDAFWVWFLNALVAILNLQTGQKSSSFRMVQLA
jgi:hypothetical protein